MKILKTNKISIIVLKLHKSIKFSCIYVFSIILSIFYPKRQNLTFYINKFTQKKSFNVIYFPSALIVLQRNSQMSIVSIFGTIGSTR